MTTVAVSLALNELNFFLPFFVRLACRNRKEDISFILWLWFYFENKTKATPFRKEAKY